MSRKAYKEDVARRLQILSGNKCAFPTCTTEILVSGDADTYVGQICHICAANPGGPRYNPDQTDDERNGFENLMIMCATHNTVIDRNVKKYTVEVLLKMKDDHESQFRANTEADTTIVEKLLEEKAVGIRSFSRGTEYMDNELEAVLDLGGHFSGRNIRENKLWHGNVIPEVQVFLNEQIKDGVAYRLHLAAHTCIGFAAGFFLDSKAGKDVTPVQSTMRGKLLWEPDMGKNIQGPLCEYKEHDLSVSGGDIVLVLSITNDIFTQVQEYVAEHLPMAGRILECKTLPQPLPTSVRDGTHAFRIAEEIASKLHGSRRANERGGTLHIFASAPIGFMFFIGQLAHKFGKTILYEYDMENHGPYSPSVTLPLS